MTESTESLARVGQHAVVAGGSLAGMLAARVLSPYFDRVTVLERDVLAATPGPRRMTPQSHHVHILLKGGENAINRLLPGFQQQIEAHGSHSILAGHDLVAGSELGVAPRWDSGMVLHAQSRWMLEHCVRQQALAAAPNVVLRPQATVRGLQYDAELNRVTGVHIDAEDGQSSISCDLLIDATGRGEAGLRWLTALSLPLPEVEEVLVDFGYSSVLVELDDDSARDWKGIVVGNLPRVGARGAVLLPIEGGRYICSLGGRAGDYPPDNVDDVLAFTASLPQPMLHDALSRARFVSPVARMIYPANGFRHYERLESLPTGLIPLGDALCSFNPTYGQGMSSAALQAEALSDTLRESSGNLDLQEIAQAYLQRAVDVARMPWRQANYNDLHYPTTQGDRSMFTPEEMKYRMEVQMAAARDMVVRKISHEVGQLLLPFERLMEDDIRARVAAALAKAAT